MESISYLENDFPDPFFDIIELDYSFSEKNKSNDSFYDFYFFPLKDEIKKDKIPEAKKQFDIDKDYTAAIRSINFIFPFQYQAIQTILQIQLKHNNLNKYEDNLVYILYSYISWSAMYQKSNSINHIEDLLNAINFFSGSLKYNLPTFLSDKYLQILNNAFVHVIIKYIKTPDINLFPSIQEYIRMFCAENQKYFPKSIFILPPLLWTFSETNYYTGLLTTTLTFFINSTDDIKTLFANFFADGLKRGIYRYNKTAIKCYSIISQYLDDNRSFQFSIILPHALLDYLNQNNIQMTDYKSSENQIMNLKLIKNLYVAYQFNDDINEKDKKPFNIEDSDIFLIDTHAQFMCQNEELNSLIILILTGIKSKEKYVDNFLKEFSSNIKSKNEFSIFLYITKLLYLISKNIDISLYINHLYFSDVICTKTNCLNDPLVSQLNIMRQCFVDILLYQKPEIIAQMLRILIPVPLLFAETLHRLTASSTKFENALRSDNQNSILDSLADAYIYNIKNTLNQSSIDNTKENDENNEIDNNNSLIDGFDKIEQNHIARTSILSFIHNYKHNVSLMEQFIFSRERFISALMLSIFDENLKDFIFNELTDILKSFKNLEDSTFGSILNNIISSFPNDIPIEKPIKLLIKIIQMLINIFQKSKKLPESFSIVMPKIIQFLNKLDNSDYSREFFLLNIQLFNLFLHGHKMKNSYLRMFNGAITKCFGSYSTGDVYKSLFQYLSGNVSDGNSNETKFIIKQPLVLQILFNLTEMKNNVDDLIDLCNKFIDICSYSEKNCVLCCETGFDLYLVEKISLRWDEKDNEKIVDSLLSLYKVISLHSATAPAVHKFFSLFCPKDDILPLFYEKGLKFLNSLFEDSYKIKFSSIPFSNTRILQKDVDFTKSFITFIFWVYPEQCKTEYRPYLLKSDGFFIFFDNKSIVISNNSTSMQYKSIDCLEEKQWNFLVFKFYNEHDSLQIQVHSPNQNNTFDVPFKENGIIFNKKLQSIEFGGHMPTSVHSSKPFLMGPLACFDNITPREINALSQPDFINFRKTSANMLFNFIPQNISTASIKNFIHTFISQCHCEVLIPLFKYIYSKNKEGYTILNYKTYLIDILSKVLMWSDESEKKFSSIHGFAVIAYHFKKYNPEDLCYDFFLDFRNLLNIFNTEDLKQQLFDDILLNISVWSRSPGKEQLNIYWKWSQDLFKFFKPYFLKSLSFSTLLTQLVIYYRDNNNKDAGYDETIPLYQPDMPEYNAKEIRQALIQICIDIGLCSFTFEDYKLLISFCISSQNNELIGQLLHILLQLLLSNTNPIQQISTENGISNVVEPLLQLIKSKPPSDILLKIIDIILNILNLYVKESPIDDIDITLFKLMKEIQIYSNDQSFIQRLLTQCMENSKINILRFPLFCWCSFLFIHHTDDKSFDIPNNINKIPLIPEFLKSKKLWAFWPFLLLKKNQDENDEKWNYDILTFVLYNEPDLPINIMGIYSLLSFVCILLNCNVHSIHALFFKVLFNDISKDKNLWTLLQDKLILIATNFLFNNINTDQKQEFKLENFDELLNQINQLSTPPEQIFAISIDYSTMKTWDDYDIADDLINKILKQNAQKYIFLILLINCYMYASALSNNNLQRIPQLKKDISHIYLEYKKYLGDNQALLNYSKHLLHLQPKSTEQNSSSNDEFDFSQFDQVMSQQFSKYERIAKTSSLITIYKQISKDLKDYFSLESSKDNLFNECEENNLSQYYKSIKQQTLQKMKQLDISAKKQWHYIWSILTGDGGGPWKNASSEEVHKKRDSSFCSFYVPFKLKRNWNFNNHQQASNARANGGAEEQLPLVGRIPQHLPKQTENQDQKPNHIKSCTVIKITKEKNGSIIIGNDRINITFDKEYFTPLEIKFSDIILLLHQDYLHFKENAFEIFTFLGSSYFIVLNKDGDGDDQCKYIIKQIERNLNPDAKERSKKFNYNFDQITKEWKEGRMSNFEYLIAVNMYCHRSFNVTSQYPIIPWVLSCWNSETLDLSNRDSYRDLEKPVGCLGADRLQSLIEKYDELLQYSPPAYYYVSGPMCSLIVFHYLIRMEPYATLHIELQSGRFDCPNRLFSSLPKLYKQICHDPNDFNELIPEFFFMPEFLKNWNNFDLGLEDESPNCDVILPKWANNDPFYFVYMHRKALESDFVSEKLSNWIDLLYGYKQKGDFAKESYNIYAPELIDDSWTNEVLNDPQKKDTYRSSKLYFGQLPSQRFKEHHPDKMIIKDIKQECDIIELDKGFYPFLILYNNQESSFYLVDMKGKSKYLSIDTSKVEKKDEKTIETKILEKVNLSGVFYTTYNNSIFLLLDKNNSMYKFNPKTGECHNVKEDIQSIAGSKNFVLTINKDNIISLYHNDDFSNTFREASFYKDSPKCCCISEDFHLFVIASRDGSVLLHSYTSQETNVNLIQLSKGCIPKFVAVSKGWGFVVTITKIVDDISNQKTKSKIFVHTINGLLVKEKIIDTVAQISHMCVFTSRKGFDYILISHAGKIECAELFNLEFTSVPMKRLTKIIYLSYDEVSRCVIGVNDYGEILYTPYDPEL